MKTPLLLIITFTALVGWTPLKAQFGQGITIYTDAEYEAAAAPLRNAPVRQYSFSKATLSDCMRLIAADAGIGFFGLPDQADGGDRLVTFTLNAPPFVALETLANANGVTLIPKNGIWYLRPANDKELIGRIYEINYNAQELVTKNSQGGSTSGVSGGGSFGGGGGASGLNLQGSPDFFVTEPSRILEDIENLLDIPTTGGNAVFAPTASVDNVTQLAVSGADLVSRPASAAGGGASEEGGKSRVIWNSDSNTLYVVATRQQHQWIEAYLASADRPQPMISVEVKFIETRKDPTTDFGIDWNGVTGDNGLELTLSDNSGPIDLNRIPDYTLPTAVLSYSDLNWKLRAIYEDRNAKAVSFPRMVTLDNREVSFRSVVNQPVLGSSASASLGAGATQTSSIEYLPIGTVINILPKRMAGDKILLNVSVTISDIVGTEFINGNPFPIATSRVYTAPLTVESGYTVAISGLDAARTNETDRGVPVLGRLPVIGYAFKNRREERNRQHLMMLITPVSLDPGGREGLTKKPITAEPWKRPPVDAGGYGKQPLYEQPAYPVNEVPTFHSAQVDEAVDKKASQTFGQKTETMAVATPVEDAVIEERELSASVEAPSSSSELQTAVEAVESEMPQAVPVDELLAGVTRKPTMTENSSLQPVPDALNTPVVVQTLAEAGLAPTPVPEPSSPEMIVAEPDTPPVSDEPLVAEAEAPVADVETPKSPKKAEEKRVAAESQSQVASIRSEMVQLQKELSKIPDNEESLSAVEGQKVMNVYEKAQGLLSQVDEARGQEAGPLQGELGDVWWDLINVKTQALKMSRRSPESLANRADGEDAGE